MDLSTLAPFALTSLAIELTPGPNMVWLATLTLAEGRRAGFAALAGVALGLGMMGLAAGLGLGALLLAMPAAYHTLRWAGVAYLLWLALQTWRGDDDNGDMARIGAGHRIYFQRGLITNLLNPKAFVFFLTVLPAFLPPGSGAAGNILLGGIYVAVATAIHLAIVLAASAARSALHADRNMNVIRRFLAILLAGVAVWLAAQG